MDSRGLSKSDLARLIWGSCTDPKTGYMVAKKRDRITAWVNGKAFPTDENLDLIAKALGITVEELTRGEQLPPPRPYLKWSFETVLGEPDKLLLTVDGRLPPKLGQQLVQGLAEIMERKRPRKQHAYHILPPVPKDISPPT
jgi:transcriptional regulator with XRE-family HTH domain